MTTSASPVGRRFILDANALLDFQGAGLLDALVDASRHQALTIAEQVRGEVAILDPGDSSELRGKKKLMDAALQRSNIETIEILPGTPEESLMRALLGPVRAARKKDHGEAATVAVAKTRAEVVVVTGDTTASLWALNELFHGGERVMRVPVFIRTLHEVGALDAAAVKAVSERAASHGAVPTWWAAWLAGV